MKRTILVVLTILTLLVVPTVAMADSGEVATLVSTVLIENGVEIATTFLIALIGVFGAWLSTKLAKITQLKTVNAAQQEVIKLAQQTVGELQQTVVDGLKAAHKDGKLTQEEITALGTELLEKTEAKMSASAADVLTAAKVDVAALITGAAEHLISVWHEET